MLKSLYIRNYALIDELDMGFDGGMSVITGETGAGKSIILGALGLILGQRAKFEALRDPEQKCIIEGQFDLNAYGLEAFFSKNDLDFSSDCILRREILPSGKSRSFINDTPASLQIMKELGEQLVDIHSQNRTIALNTADVQLALLDQYARNKEEVEAYKLQYREYTNTRKALKKLEEEELQFRKERDYLQYQFDELESAGIKKGESDELKAELERLENAGMIREALAYANEALVQADNSVSSVLNEVLQRLRQAGQYLPEAKEMAERTGSALIELKDIADEASSLAEDDDIDPGRMEQAGERLDELYRLQKKHGVDSDLELLGVMDKISVSLYDSSSREEEINKLKTLLVNQEKELVELAAKLRKQRKAAKPALEKQLLSVLSKLGMKNAAFGVAIEELEDAGISGTEKVRFLFNANKGGRLMPLSEVASGGERSRLMLAIKSCITERSILPTIIFDEIDSGVGGEIASKVGEVMDEMGKSIQVVAITHLPQIAAKGKRHYLVFKETDRHKTYTRVKPLEGQDRVKEIASLLSGERVGPASELAARELLGEKAH